MITIEITTARIMISIAPAVPNPPWSSGFMLIIPIAVRILSNEKTMFNKAICTIALDKLDAAFPDFPSSSPSILW